MPTITKMPAADEEEDHSHLRRLPMLFRLPRRSATTPPARRRKMAVVRLGSSRRGLRWSGGGRRILAGIFRRMRLRWLMAKYRAALKRLRACQSALVRDMIEGASTMDAVQSRILMESYFAAPFLPVTSVHTHYYA
ncbi:hypothetical protein Cni_G15268 [Canna indica]|uniref:Uncharacterized protein n=1 Tax=Canna indica TaxID=4628 RepID=A0AAQ3KD31_9LILI|nr:hypothetical protein Cni_G15268 [Canna indica]